MSDADTQLPVASPPGGSVELDRIASRARAVNRVFAGGAMVVTGMIATVVVEIADLAGSSQIARAAQFGLALFRAAGFLVIASAATHLARFGGRRSALAFASFGGVALCALVAAAEMFETSLLASRYLSGLDTWALAGILVFGLVAAVLMGADPSGRGQIADQNKG